MNEKTIIIESFEELIDKMESMEFYVEWEVTSDIGPSWIGSLRTIDFYLDRYKLTKTKFCKELENKLITIVAIPETSKDHVIYGDGDIILKNKKLEIYYEYKAAIPYQEPDEYREEKVIFYP